MTKFVVKDSATKKCLHCPWRTPVLNYRGTWEFDINTNGVEGQHFCELIGCDFENNIKTVGMAFMERHETVQNRNFAKKNRRTCDMDQVGTNIENCRTYDNLCETYDIEKEKCEHTKRVFVDDTLKPLITQVAEYVGS